MAKDSRFKFTTLRLEKATCPDGKKCVYVFNKDTRGLCLYVGATGAKVFYLYRRVGGRPTRLRLGQFPHELTIDQARTEARKASGDIARGNDPHREKLKARAGMTLGELFAVHIEAAKLHNRQSSWEENQNQYDNHLKRWAGRKLTDITRQQVQAWHAKIGTDSGRYAANRALALLHHMYRTTAKNCGYTGENPAAGVQKFKEKSRERLSTRTNSVASLRPSTPSRNCSATSSSCRCSPGQGGRTCRRWSGHT